MPAIDRIEHLSGHSMSLRLWSLEHGVFEGSNDRLGQSPLCTDHSSSKFMVNSFGSLFSSSISLHPLSL